MTGPKRIKSLQIEENMPFQVFEWILQRLGWIAMAAVIVMAAKGKFGNDADAARIAGEQGGPVWVRYDRYPRWQTRTVLVVHAMPGSFDKKARISINDGYLERMMVERVTPEPESMESAAEKTTFTFTAEERQNPVVVRFHLQPETPGKARARIAAGEEHAVEFEQFVFP